MKANELKTGVILNYLSMAINLVVGFIYVQLLIHYLGKEQYGLYQLIGSFIAYMSLMDFGLQGTIITYYSRYMAWKDESGKENVLALSSIIYLFLTGIAILIGIIIYFNLETIFHKNLTGSEIYLAKQMFALLIFNVAFTIPSNIFAAVINSNEKFIFVKTVALLQSILRPVLIVAILMNTPSAFLVVLAMTLFNLLVAVLNMYYCFFVLKTKIKLHEWDTPLVLEMLRYAFPIFVVALIDQIFWRTNQIILGIFIGTGAVAIYAVAFQIISNYMYLSIAMTGEFLPSITKLVAGNVSDEELTDLFIKIGRLQYLLLGCVLSGFILLGRQFINLWVGGGYEDTYYITIIILLPFTIDLIQNIGLSILKAKNLFGYRAKVFFVISIINILVAIPLARQFGGIGCAYASGVAYFVGNVIFMNQLYYKKAGINVLAFWKQIRQMTLPILIMCSISYFVFQYPVGPPFIDFSLKAMVYAFLYLVLMWHFVMNEYEKSLVGGIFKNVFLKFRQHRHVNTNRRIIS